MTSSDAGIDEIKIINEALHSEDIAINFKNTKEFSLTDIRKIEGVSNGRVYIRVEGGYDQHRINSYPRESHVNMHKYDNIYSIVEIKNNRVSHSS